MMPDKSFFARNRRILNTFTFLVTLVLKTYYVSCWVNVFFLILPRTHFTYITKKKAQTSSYSWKEAGDGRRRNCLIAEIYRAGALKEILLRSTINLCWCKKRLKVTLKLLSLFIVLCEIIRWNFNLHSILVIYYIFYTEHSTNRCQRLQSVKEELIHVLKLGKLDALSETNIRLKIYSKPLDYKIFYSVCIDMPIFIFFFASKDWLIWPTKTSPHLFD